MHDYVNYSISSQRFQSKLFIFSFNVKKKKKQDTFLPFPLSDRELPYK